MGGRIATRFTLAHPERVAALLIIDSASASGLPISPEMRIMRETTIQLAEGIRYNPTVIYAALPSFGQTGPYREKPALDIIVQAMGGLMSFV